MAVCQLANCMIFFFFHTDQIIFYSSNFLTSYFAYFLYDLLSTEIPQQYAILVTFVLNISVSSQQARKTLFSINVQSLPQVWPMIFLKISVLNLSWNVKFVYHLSASDPLLVFQRLWLKFYPNFFQTLLSHLYFILLSIFLGVNLKCQLHKISLIP